jgi:predicted  nucleic acid-binding Zn-ribbon protein
MATSVLKLFLGSGRVPASIKPTLDKILTAKRRLEQIRRETDRVSKLKSELSSDQSRIRSNLNLLRKVKGNAALRARLTRNLAKLEDRLTKLTSQYVKLDEERARLRGTMQALIGEITLDLSK